MATLSTLNLTNLGKPTVPGITNKNLVPSSLTKVSSSSPGATSTKPTTISTPSVKTPAAQSYINSQMPSTSGNSFNDQLEAIKQSALAIKAKIPGVVQAEIPQAPPVPQKQEKTSYQKAMDSYLAAMGNSLKIGDTVTKAELGARREYNGTLDAPGGLLGGAQQSASFVDRKNTNNLADLGILQNSANSAEAVALKRLELEKGLQPSTEGFNLSAGQQRYQYNPATGKTELVATGGPDTPSTPASIQEYNFAKQQGYTGTFDEFKNSGGSTNPNAILTPTEATALGVDYGTTRQAAYGKTPTKPLTESQAKDVTYGQRGQQATSIIDQLANDIVKFNPAAYATYSLIEPNALGNAAVPDVIRQYKQAERNFLTAVLRRESGASISPSEFSTGEKQYFPRPGDDAKTLAQKKQLRDTAIKSFLQNAGQSGATSLGSSGGTITWDSI